MEYKHRLYLIGGLPRHGKSTVASFLSSLSNLKHGNTSDIIYRELAKEKGVDEEVLRAMDKSQVRGDLITMGDKLCLEDPAFLVKQLAREGVQVITGVRKMPELESLRKFANITLIWVIRPQAATIRDNTGLSADQADHIIINDTTLDALYVKASQLFDTIIRGSKLKSLG